MYQDVNLRSYFGFKRPHTRYTFDFCLGRCFIIHFPKRTLVHIFLLLQTDLFYYQEKKTLIFQIKRIEVFYNRLSLIFISKETTLKKPIAEQNKMQTNIH